MLAMSRRVTVFAVVALAGLLLTGCGSDVKDPNTAALVGTQVVPLDTTQQDISAVLAKETEARSYLQQHKFDQAAREILAVKVKHLLAQEAAKQENIMVNQDQVDKAVASQGGAKAASAGTIYTAQSYRDSIWDSLVATALGEKYAARLSVTVDYTGVTDQAAAEKMVKQIEANPSKIHEIMAKGADEASDTGTQVVSVANSQQAAGNPLFGFEAGSVVAFPVQQAGSAWAVVHITKREVKPTAADPQQKFDPDVTGALGERLLGLYAQQLGITINPRYGVWDAVSLSIAASSDQAAGIYVAPNQLKS